MIAARTGRRWLKQRGQVQTDAWTAWTDRWHHVVAAILGITLILLFSFEWLHGAIR